MKTDNIITQYKSMLLESSNYTKSDRLIDPKDYNDPRVLGYLHNNHHVELHDMPEHHKKIYDTFNQTDKAIYNAWRNDPSLTFTNKKLIDPKDYNDPRTLGLIHRSTNVDESNMRDDHKQIFNSFDTTDRNTYFAYRTNPDLVRDSEYKKFHKEVIR